MGSESEKPKKRRSWRDDYFAASEVLSQLLTTGLPFVMVALLAAVTLPRLAKAKAQRNRTVIVYASQDQVYAEPILQDFTKQTGIKVRAVYDSEAVKTVGLANRLLAERSRPQCDVFWNNEEFRTRQLAAQNTFRETNAWAAVGYRSRRIVINTNRLAFASAPHSLLELTNELWRGKVALAYPLFGTTATHLLALRQHWGEEKWGAWCRGLQANKPFLVDGNSAAVQQAARGEAWLGLTDSDDIAAEQSEGAPVRALPITEETLLIPNTIAVGRGAPHPEEAQRLFEYLQRRKVIERLIAAKALEGFSDSEVKTPTLKPDWSALLRDLDGATAELGKILLR
jgi:iron(III) transport system substrate-binding protein